MRLARLLTLALAFMIGVLTLAGCGGGGGGGNAAPGGGDTTAPTVSITAPASGTGVTGATTVSASASDNVGVTKVELYLNGTLLATLNSAPYSYSWDTTALAVGSHALTAKAYDAAGNVGNSASVSLTVATPIDATAPVVSLTSPAGGATVSGTTTVSASASDNVGVTKIEFYLDGVLQVTDTSAPFSWSWNTLASTSGSHTLSTKAYDAAGNSGASAGVVVTVPDTTTPAVSITTPASGASVTGVANVTASASDDVGVSRVEFYVNGVLQGTDVAAPYSFSWDTTALKYGSYTLSAKAYDAANNSSQSTDVTLAVPIRVSRRWGVGALVGGLVVDWWLHRKHCGGCRDLSGHPCRRCVWPQVPGYHAKWRQPGICHTGAAAPVPR